MASLADNARPLSPPASPVSDGPFVATAMKFLAQRAPIDWILGKVNIPFLED